MTQGQKIIKYISIAFACYLIINILFVIISFLNIFGNIFNNDKKDTTIEYKLEDNNSYNILNIDLYATNLKIKQGSQLTYETNNKNIESKQIDNKLSIKEKKHLNLKANYTLSITIPKNFEFDIVNIDAGASKIEIDELTTKKAELNIGAGKVTIKNFNVKDEIDIDGGAGSVDIYNSKLNNLDLDMGVGKVNLVSMLTGNNNIDAGIGKLNITLLDTLDNYRFKVEKGIGTINIDGNNIKNNTNLGTGNTLIDIEGGIGNINLNSK